MVPGGLVKHVGDALAARGFSESNLLSRPRTRTRGPGGYANFRTFNTAAPGLATVTDPMSFYRLLDPPPADPQLYSFLVRQVTAAVRRADDDRAPAQAGWGKAEIHGLTQNRSIEAHLADHGIQRERGQGSAADDPEGVDHTIDPQVNVLRVDKLVDGRQVPIGGWSTFADHGTVTKSSFPYYNQDHHASALQVFERGVRREGGVPRGQAVLNVYGNSNEGDQSAGLVRDGPAASDYVGRVEAAAMLRAWRQAGTALSTRAGARRALDAHLLLRAGHRGRQRGGLRDDRLSVPHRVRGGARAAVRRDEVPLEGTRNPLPVPGQGHKVGHPAELGHGAEGGAAHRAARGRRRDRDAARRADGRGGRPGARRRAAVHRARSRRGVRAGRRVHPVLHDAGGVRPSALRGRLHALRPALVEPAAPGAGRAEPPARERRARAGGLPARPDQRRVAGRAALRARAPRPGRSPNSRPARCAASIRRPSRGTADRSGSTGRWAARSWWCSAASDGRWRRADSDLGLGMLWKVDDEGAYRALWEVPRAAAEGLYRLQVRANRYRLTSPSFQVLPARTLTVRAVERPAGQRGGDARLPGRRARPRPPPPPAERERRSGALPGRRPDGRGAPEPRHRLHGGSAGGHAGQRRRPARPATATGT